MLCPKHGDKLEGQKTRWGTRWQCPQPDCTVACWNGDTSTPADAETRELRHRCHEMFDPLWRHRVRWSNRTRAYLWLQGFMKLPPKKAHIGMFDKDQCLKLLGHLQQLA